MKRKGVYDIDMYFNDLFRYKIRWVLFVTAVIRWLQGHNIDFNGVNITNISLQSCLAELKDEVKTNIIYISIRVHLICYFILLSYIIYNIYTL